MAEELSLEHFDLGTFVDYVYALKQERDALRAQLPSQGGEAVEVVASIAVDAEGVVRDFTLEPGLDRHPGGYTVTPLMTVAQHQRILAASAGSAEPVAWHTEDHLTDKSATTYDPEIAKRWRAKGWPVTPLYTHPADQAAEPDAELVELLRSKFPRIDPCQPVPLDEKAHCCEYTIYVERERLHRIIDAKLASLKGEP